MDHKPSNHNNENLVIFFSRGLVFKKDQSWRRAGFSTSAGHSLCLTAGNSVHHCLFPVSLRILSGCHVGHAVFTSGTSAGFWWTSGVILVQAFLPAGKGCGSRDKEGVLSQRVIILRRGRECFSALITVSWSRLPSWWLLLTYQYKATNRPSAAGCVTPDLGHHFLAVYLSLLVLAYFRFFWLAVLKQQSWIHKLVQSLKQSVPPECNFFSRLLQPSINLFHTQFFCAKFSFMYFFYRMMQRVCTARNRLTAPSTGQTAMSWSFPLRTCTATGPFSRSMSMYAASIQAATFPSSW